MVFSDVLLQHLARSSQQQSQEDHAAVILLQVPFPNQFQPKSSFSTASSETTQQCWPAYRSSICRSAVHKNGNILLVFPRGCRRRVPLMYLVRSCGLRRQVKSVLSVMFRRACGSQEGVSTRSTYRRLSMSSHVQVCSDSVMQRQVQ